MLPSTAMPSEMPRFLHGFGHGRGGACLLGRCGADDEVGTDFAHETLLVDEHRHLRMTVHFEG
jgi:hypothetical protein